MMLYHDPDVRNYSRKIAGIITLFIILLLSFGSTAHAGGPVHGAKAAGMGTAFIGLADDPSAILHNPAGLIQSKSTQIYGGITGLTIYSRYKSETGDTEETERQYFFPPHLYISSDAGTEDFVFGIGFHSPFGIGGRKWDRDGITRYQATKENIATFAVNPTVAWQVYPGIAIAGGVDYLYASLEAEQMIDQSALGAGDGRSNFEARGDGWGYNLGLLAEIGRSFRLGLAYRSKIDVDFDGEMKIRNIAPALQPVFGGSTFKTDVSTSSTFPEIIGGGISYDFNDFTVAFDVELVRWSSFDREDVDLEKEVPAAGVTDGEKVFEWKDSWQYKIGMEYRATRQLSLRTGYALIKHFVPERTLSPGNPDADQHNFAIGAGYKMNDWIVDAFYNAGFFEDRTVDNDILSGKYETFIHYAGISVGYTF
jgi:long-chain fatty acid transport protein